MNWQHLNPVKILFSDSIHNQIADLTKDKKHVFLLCSNRFTQTEHYNKIISTLSNCTTFKNIEHNPSLSSCQKAMDCAKKTLPDTILAIGGGSVIDTAKAVRMSLYRSCFDIKDLIALAPSTQNDPENKPLFIACPSNHGTSSELTKWATIWDKEHREKLSLSDEENYPDYAIYNVNLTIDLPVKSSIICTMDALSHSFEALWNKHANPETDTLAIKAIKLIIDNLDKLTDPISIDTRKKLLEASMFAGLAFSNTATAAAHSISYPLTMHFDIPHGIACSMPLIPLLEINKDAMQQKINNLLQLLKMKSTKELTDKIKSSIKGRIPFSLSEYNIEESDLINLANQSFTKGRMDNNIKNLSKSDVLKILKQIYH